MELYQLRSFATVAELGHLTRAADRLHVSQLALSAQIKALEDELGVPLFDRGPTGMTLTPAGKRLLPDALKVIADTEALRGAAASIKGAVAGRPGSARCPTPISSASPISCPRRSSAFR